MKVIDQPKHKTRYCLPRQVGPMDDPEYIAEHTFTKLPPARTSLRSPRASATPFWHYSLASPPTQAAGECPGAAPSRRLYAQPRAIRRGLRPVLCLRERDDRRRYPHPDRRASRRLARRRLRTCDAEELPPPPRPYGGRGCPAARDLPAQGGGQCALSRADPSWVGPRKSFVATQGLETLRIRGISTVA